MQFFRSLAELFPRFARRSGALERAVRPSLPSRRLRLEPLENRELLAVDAFAVPFGPLPLENVANEAAPVVVSASVLADDGATLSVRTETAEPVAPPSFEQLMESLGQVKIESLDAETDVASSSESEETPTELQPSFIVDGVEYYSLSQAVARRVVFEDSGVDVASLDEPFVIVPNANDGETSVYNAQSGGSGDSGGETSVWTLDFNGEVTTLLGTLASVGIENALLERATTVSGGASFGENGASGGAASGGGDEIESLAPNYLQVTLPALPDYYEAEVVFTGTAALGVDYEIHAPLNIINHYYNNSCFTYSGGSSQFFVLPINDAQPETLEDFTAILEQPTPTVDSGGSSYAQSYDFIFESSSVTATFVDDDHWKVSVEASDPTATERLADVEQDYGYYTFKREHQNPYVAAKIDAKVQELTKTNATNAEIDGVKALANLVTGDATYGVTVDFEALYNSESNYDAQPTVDYALSTSPLATESADAYLASFEFSSTPNQSEAPLLRYDCSGVIPASKTEALLRLNPVFDWEDEGDLFDPNYLINADLDATTPDQQPGEKARLRLLDATWSGQSADYNPLAEPTTADVEIKDGAIAELYFDYDGDGTLDPYQSTADETCYVPINDDDDNLNGVEDREESAAVANENDLRQFVAVAWLAHYGNHTLEASVTVGGNSVKFWRDEDGTIPLEPQGAEGDPVEVVDSTAGTDYHFWGVCEGVSGGVASADLEVEIDAGNPATPPIVHNDDASLKTTSYWIDLDVDSDNNNNAVVERSSLEDDYEMASPGKIIYVGDSTRTPLIISGKPTTDAKARLVYDSQKIKVYDASNVYIASGSEITLSESGVNYSIEALTYSENNESEIRCEIYAPNAPDTVLFYDAVKVTNAIFVTNHVWYDFGAQYPINDEVMPDDYLWDCDLKNGVYETARAGESYLRTAQSFNSGFTLKFNYEFVRRDNTFGYVRPDGKPNKLSFVGNSGVKIGGTDGASEGVPEIAILDMQAIMLMLGNGNESEGLNRFINGMKFVAKTDKELKLYPNPLTSLKVKVDGYEAEPLSTLIHGMGYSRVFTEVPPNLASPTFFTEGFTSSHPQNTLEWYKDWFRFYYERFKNASSMTITHDTSDNLLKVCLDNTEVYSTSFTSTNNKLYLQSHHGSGVRFSSVSLGPSQN